MAIIVEQYFTQCGADLQSARQQAIAAKEDGKESASDPTLVRELIELHKRCQAFVDNQFQAHPNFQRALKTAFENVMNKDVGKLANAEYLAAYCDRILKKGGERLSDKEVETQLSNVVQLFSYLNDKDLFSEIYRNLLSKRLLNNKSANDDAEKSMISKLKLKCGAQFTSKMEGMRNDLLQGKDHVSKFAEFDKSGYNIGEVDFNVQVLTTGFWPSNVETKLDLPPVMKSCVEAFTAYYDESTEARKLNFVPSLGNCTVQMMFGKKKYDLNVTTLQVSWANNKTERLGTGVG
jgi:cullin 1